MGNMKNEYKKCFYFVLLLNIASWFLFIILDAVAEIIFGSDLILDGGLISIPCILTIVYCIVEKRKFDSVCFKMKYNIFLICIFVIITFLFGAFDFFLLSKGIILIPQYGKFLDGVEYVIFPFSYSIISLLLGFVIKIVSYITYKVRFCRRK